MDLLRPRKHWPLLQHNTETGANKMNKEAKERLRNGPKYIRKFNP